MNEFGVYNQSSLPSPPTSFLRFIRPLFHLSLLQRAHNYQKNLRIQPIHTLLPGSRYYYKSKKEKGVTVFLDYSAPFQKFQRLPTSSRVRFTFLLAFKLNTRWIILITLPFTVGPESKKNCVFLPFVFLMESPETWKIACNHLIKSAFRLIFPGFYWGDEYNRENGSDGINYNVWSRVNCVHKSVCGIALWLYCNWPFAWGQPMDEWIYYSPDYCKKFTLISPSIYWLV